MILTKISLENFGLFRDRQDFNLKPSTDNREKTIILFGGMNGAGKTTLFEAFKLCLYGKTLPEFYETENYYKYIKSKIHRSPKLILQPVSAIISLEFEFTRSGQIDIFHVERRWHIKDIGLDEEFEVKMNGEKLEEIAASHWQDFVVELLPIGISKLFFFDGEQIQSLARDDTDEIQLKDSFYSLLGLDLVIRLHGDLQIHLTRHLKKSDENWAKKLNNMYSEHSKIEDEIEKEIQKRGDIENKKNNRQKKVNEFQSRLSNEGGYFAKEQDQLLKRKTILEVEIQQKYEQLRELCAGALPFTFIPEYCLLLRERLIDEKNTQIDSLASEKFIDNVTSLKKETISKVQEIRDIDKKHMKKLTYDIEKLFDATIKKTSSKDKDKNIMHINHLSISDQNRILGWIDDVLEIIPTKTKQLVFEIERSTTELQKIEDQLKKVPSDEVIGPIVSQLNETNKEIGYFEGLLKDIDEKLTQLRYRLKLSFNQIKDMETEKKKNEKLNRGLDLAVKIQGVLKEYEIRLKNERIFELEKNIVECMNILMHKKLFNKVTIDPDTFHVTLYSDNKPIPKEELSAGEKQIYAIAVLWALAQNSGRNLPFIIDTPLGRLDSEHRLNLVQNFFPVASSQVLIFSTDTEIDKRYFEELSSYISRSYKLEYDRKKGHTIVKDNEFFWDEKVTTRTTKEEEKEERERRTRRGKEIKQESGSSDDNTETKKKVAKKMNMMR